MTSAPTSPTIIWPEKFLPGTTDNFVSNETIVKGLSAADIWKYLADITKWESYYWNCSEITPPESGPFLEKGDKFSFSTFGFPPLPSEVYESVKPSKTEVGRIAWRAISDGDGDEDKAVDVYHAWVIEDLDHDRVRILTQESQIGKPAAELSTKKPNPMLNGHQDWLDGLVKAAREGKQHRAELLALRLFSGHPNRMTTFVIRLVLLALLLFTCDDRLCSKRLSPAPCTSTRYQ
ncbi:hypothetical protein KCU81_g753, partial [Aureobasidium melanogenum]